MLFTVGYNRHTNVVTYLFIEFVVSNIVLLIVSHFSDKYKLPFSNLVTVGLVGLEQM